MARWVKLKYRKLNRRDILNSEIVALHSDIQELRMAITSGELKGDHGAAAPGGFGEGTAQPH